MLKILVTLVLAAVAGVPTYFLILASQFGVSSGAPLGQLEPIETWLGAQGFSRATLDAGEAHRRKLEGNQFYAFTEIGSSRKDEEKQVVAVGVDGSGAIRTIRTSFFSGKVDLGIPYSKTEEFTELFWSEVTGSQPEFSERHKGEGWKFVEGLGATASSSSVTGDWYKQYLEVNKHRSIVDFVVFSRR